MRSWLGHGIPIISYQPKKLQFIGISVYYSDMSLYFTSQMLVLALLVPVVTRFLFNRSARIDTIVILSPFALFVTVLNLFAYGITITNLILLAVTFFVFFINFRAFLRLLNGLVVDYYRGPFIFGCIISWFMIAGTLGLLIWYCPMADTHISMKGKAAEPFSVTRQVYTGSAYGGLRPKTDYFSSPAAVLYEVTPKAEANNTVFVYVPSVCTRTDEFLPAMKILAEKGYPVISADMSVKDIPYFRNWRDSLWSMDFCMRWQRLRHPDEFTASLTGYNEKKAQEAVLLMDLARKQYPEAELVLIYDGENRTEIEKVLPDVKQIVIEFDGCALLALVNPLEAELLNSDRWSHKNRQDFKDLPSQIVWYIINCLG